MTVQQRPDINRVATTAAAAVSFAAFDRGCISREILSTTSSIAELRISAKTTSIIESTSNRCSIRSTGSKITTGSSSSRAITVRRTDRSCLTVTTRLRVAKLAEAATLLCRSAAWTESSVLLIADDPRVRFVLPNAPDQKRAIEFQVDTSIQTRLLNLAVRRARR